MDPDPSCVGSMLQRAINNQQSAISNQQFDEREPV